MLESRLDEDERARARLSHAIHSRTSENDWLYISSADLDELVHQPLPGVQQQLEFLVRRLASQLGDDKFGRVRISLESLAGVVGATNGDAVSRLIDYAVKEGIVEREAEDQTFGLSPKGWIMAEPPLTASRPVQQTDKASTSPKIQKSYRNGCGGDRNVYLRAHYTTSGLDEQVGQWSDTYDVLECCGCGEISVRRTLWRSELDSIENDPITGAPRMVPGTDVSYWPPTTTRRKPDWSDELDDEVLRKVFDEVYQALNAGLIVLASIGTRTLLDRAMFLRVGDPKRWLRWKAGPDGCGWTYRRE